MTYYLEPPTKFNERYIFNLYDLYEMIDSIKYGYCGEWHVGQKFMPPLAALRDGVGQHVLCFGIDGMTLLGFPVVVDEGNIMYLKVSKKLL